MAPNKISFTEGKINVPDNPIIPFIEGDGIGVDIWPASKHVFDSAVEKAYGGKEKLNGRKFWQVRRPMIVRNGFL